MVITKSVGVTKTERLLADLCERSFLKLWSYPNPFKADRDELCDLLAVFENHVFVFFDRENRQLDDEDKDPEVIWERWKRKTIDAQIRTANGAERYIRSGRPIFLDNECRAPFPIPVDPATAIIHKIIVAHGAKEACQRYSDQNVYGSLAICYSADPSKSTVPFKIDLDKSNPVHVFDSHNLSIIFGTLDTAADFTQYMDAKIEAVSNLDILLYCGEEDLLAHYYSNFDESEDKHFIGTKDKSYNGVLVSEGEWKAFVATNAYRRKRDSDKVSYFWDELIQKTAQHALDATLLGDVSFRRGESAIHVMAREPRFARRGLSDHMIRSIQGFPDTNMPNARSVSLMPSFHEGTVYVFLQLKMLDVRDYENDYRPKRRAMLEIACGAAKNAYPDITTVVGMAIDAPKFAGDRNSEDFILMKCDDWPDEQREHYERLNEVFGFFRSPSLVQQQKTIKEFPDAPMASKHGGQKVGRNDRCPCGSGLKYKRCCLA